MSKRLLIALLAVIAAAFALSACGSSSADSDKAKVEDEADQAEAQADQGDGTDGEKPKDEAEANEAASCDGYTAGEDDVIRTFCDGSAKVELTVGGNDYTLTGGECATQGGYFAVNIGVVTGPDFTGSKPDYFGSNMPEADGDFGDGDQAFATFAVDGQEYSVPNTTGSHDADGATFSGKTMDGGIEVTGTVTC
jgi:hypothetical protein